MIAAAVGNVVIKRISQGVEADSFGERVGFLEIACAALIVIGVAVAQRASA